MIAVPQKDVGHTDAVMEFPVDILAMLSHEELERCAEDYMSDLLHSNPDEAESFALSNTRQVPISVSNVGTVPMYGADLTHKLLALFAPEDPFTAVALYLAGQWWAVEDVLKTADCSRTGLLKVKTLGERVVLYVLNRIMYRAKEMNKNEVPFLCHHHSDYAKILWKDGEAVGFYSVKPKGSLCSSFLTQRYMLPVMDSIFVRKAHRGQGHGLQILEDFVDSFKEDTLGLKFPLSHTMYKVCEQYLRKYPADEDLLWEVEGVGGPFQRSEIASKIKSMSTRDTDENETLMDEETTTPRSMIISEEVMEDVVVLKQVKVTEDVEASVHTVNELRRKRLREDSEDKEIIPEKINRVVDVIKEPALQVEEEQLVPTDEEALAVVTPEVHAQDEAQAVEVELEQKVEPEQVNGELISSLGEEEPVSNEVSGDLSPIEEEEKEGHKDENMEEEATLEALESKDAVAAAPEEPDEGLTEELEEASSIVEKEVSSPKEVVHSSIEGMSLSGGNEGPLQMENKTPLTAEDKVSLQIDKDPVSGEGEGDVSLITRQEVPSQAEVSSVSVEEGEEMVKDEDEPEPEAPALKVPDENVAVPSEIMPVEEAVNEELTSGSEPVEMVDGAAEPCSSVDSAEEEQMVTAVDIDQDTVLLVGLKEVSYQQSTVNENNQESIEEMKHKGGNASEKEDETKSENEIEDNVEIMKEDTNKKEQEASVMEQEPESPEKSSDETTEPPVVDMRVLRRKTKQIQPKSKRKSKRKKGVYYSDEANQAEASEEPDEDNEEEALEPKVETAEAKTVEVEEERTTTTEEEAEERSSDDEDDPPVVDRRVLRRKTKIIHSTPRIKAKRRSKT
ncbi:soluble lamin-associated protein of 75 kDa-like isoform X2 [Scleropages formosus]|uniref:soluble lamin-associated protein of 75 kDa-like isoform X2 n=1 Tax=Scleropages formosus TaxID=113540 RepID=UPI0010FACC32|nr:soluble lamin-associated protein of 75 kDa isoform X2 [Scleropages formosus]